MAFMAASVFKMRFEGDERRTATTRRTMIRFPFSLYVASQRTRPAARINRDRRNDFKHASVFLQAHTAHALSFKQQSRRMSFFQNFHARLARTRHQARIHLGAAQPERARTSVTEPLARHVHASPASRIKASLGQLRAASPQHFTPPTAPLKVFQTLRRDKLPEIGRAHV